MGAPGSGKSACALNLAAVFEAQGAAVRCVDGGAEPPLRGADVHEDEVLLVLTPGIDAATQAYALLKGEALYGGRRRFAGVVNRVSGAAVARAVFENVASAARRFLRADLSYAGHVRDEPALWRGPHALAGFAPDAPAVADFARVAAALSRLEFASGAPLPAFSSLNHQRRYA
jgi:MinD-like ATPase involved in chromosome partitioning or flagellar assembly